jgi:hypothetical protein
MRREGGGKKNEVAACCRNLPARSRLKQLGASGIIVGWLKILGGRCAVLAIG